MVLTVPEETVTERIFMLLEAGLTDDCVSKVVEQHPLVGPAVLVSLVLLLLVCKSSWRQVCHHWSVKRIARACLSDLLFKMCCQPRPSCTTGFPSVLPVMPTGNLNCCTCRKHYS